MASVAQTADRPRATLQALPAMGALERLPVGATNYFPTPPWAVDLVLDREDLSDVRMVLEPSAGCGAICRQVRAALPQAIVTAVEIRHDLCGQLRAGEWLRLGDMVHEGDFHTWSAEHRGQVEYDLIIGNPPYHSLKGEDDAEPDRFIASALPLLREGGRLAMLLRINWACAVGRAHLINDLRPHIYASGRRIDFVGTKADGTRANGPTESHAWYVWTKGQPDGRFEVVA